MLTNISILTGLVFSSLYPLCFWLVYGHPIDTSFRKFNIGITNFIGGLTLVAVLCINFSLTIKIAVLIWKCSLLLISAYSWKKEKINTGLITLPSILGVIAFTLFYKQFITVSPKVIIVTTLGGLVLCASLFTMILGHWYLNVHGLPIKYLERSTYAFWFLLGLRGLWNCYALLTQKIIHAGDLILLYNFVARTDGFLLLVPIFFGTLLPIALIYFVVETLKAKSTQSATGILYVIVIMVLMGDLAYKYYLLKFGIVL